MSKRKLSRNRMIKAYHKATGLSYKECRARLKSINWDLGGLFNTIKPVADAAAEAMARLVEITKEATDKIMSVISEKVVPAVNEACKQISEGVYKQISEEDFQT